jgi:hypothetical protein
MVTGNSSTLTIADLALTTITLSSSNLIPTIYFDFTITATLTDQSGGSWSNSTLLSLTPVSLVSGSTSETATGGSGTFSLYGISAGIYTLTVSNGSVSGTIDIEFKKLALVFSLSGTSVLFI